MNRTIHQPAIGLILAVAAAQSAPAAGILIGVAFDVRNRTSQEVDGFSLDAALVSPGGTPLEIDHVDDLFPDFIGVIPGGGPGYAASFDWTGAPVAPGEQRRLGVYLLVCGENAMFDVQASWTQAGVPIAPEVALPGFLFEPLGGGELRYTIFNDSSSAITISQLQFKPDSPFVPIVDLAPNALPGFDQPLPDFDLAPDDSASFVFSGAGDFSLAEGSVSDTQTGEWQADFIEIQQASSCAPCDMNCDGVVDAFDIEPFLDLLFGGGVPCNTCTGDTNGDGSIDALDIEPFLECLFP